MIRYSVYILRCNDGTYYVGSTSDVDARVATHNQGRGPRCIASRRPVALVALVYAEDFQTMAEARHREVQVKNWSRAKKEALIQGDLTALRKLSRRKSD